MITADEAGSRKAAVIALAGDVDLAELPRLRDELQRALRKHHEVQVDLSAVRAIDTVCVRELLRAQALAARKQRSFGVVRASASAHRILVGADALGLLLDEDGDAAAL